MKINLTRWPFAETRVTFSLYDLLTSYEAMSHYAAILGVLENQRGAPTVLFLSG